MNLYLGSDDETGTEYALTAYDDGTMTIASRTGGDAAWSEPVAIEPVPVEPPC